MNDSIRKLIDSCRPDGHDLGLPEMQPLADLMATDAVTARQFDRSRQLDDTIAIAVQDVPTPPSLEQRLLAAVTDSAMVTMQGRVTSLAESALSEERSAGGTSVDKSDVVVSPKPGILRSRRLWMALATCASVTVIVAFALNRPSGPKISYDELVSAALTWHPAEEDWKEGNLIWKSHPLPGQIRVSGVTYRQQYKLPAYGVRSRCYKLKLTGGGPAQVFVFANTGGFTLRNAPPTRTGSTWGKCVAAWISGDLVYVLVVDGPNAERDYRDAVRKSLQLTRHRPLTDILCPTGTV